MSNMKGGLSVGLMGFMPASAAMQTLSLGAATLRMGPGGGKQILKTMGKMTANLESLDEFIKLSEEINSSIKHNRNAIKLWESRVQRLILHFAP